MYKVKDITAGTYVKEFRNIVPGMIIEVFDDENNPILDEAGHNRFKVTSHPKDVDFGLCFPVCTGRNDEDLCVDVEPYLE
jgi:hypothetical protein